MISFSARYLRRTCICINFAIDYLTINEENRPRKKVEELSVRADKMQQLEDATEAEASYSC
jgi:hypothetical protein